MADFEKMEGMKTLCDICETIEDAVKLELSNGIQNVNIQEMTLAVDMIKDLAEAKEKVAKAKYYFQITEAMSESEYGKEYDENGPMKYYQDFENMDRRGYSRRMMPEIYRDMDRERGRMYYTESGTTGNNGGRMYYTNNGGGSGRSETSRRRYFEMKNGGTSTEKMQSLEEYAKSLTEDVTEMIQGASENEKQMLRQKMQMLVQKI